MALADHALSDVAELNKALGGQDSDSGTFDSQKEEIINGRTPEVEAYLDREIVTRGDLTEFHTVQPRTKEIYISQFPLVGTAADVAVYEDTGWEGKAAGSRYPAALTLNTDYLVIELPEPLPFVKLYRVGAYWPTGYRAIKVFVNDGCGYADTDEVPAGIKDAFHELCALAWRDQSRKERGLASRSDNSGSVSRFVPALLTTALKDRLRPYRRKDFCPTWERAA